MQRLNAVCVTGERWHYAPMAKRLAQAGIMTAVIGYTLYPQANTHQMAEEVSQALTWVQDNASQYGGSPQKVQPVLALVPCRKHLFCKMQICHHIPRPFTLYKLSTHEVPLLVALLVLADLYLIQLLLCEGHSEGDVTVVRQSYQVLSFLHFS